VAAGTILVVDDDPVIVNLLRVNFEMEGYLVVTAISGAMGLEQAEAVHPDLVVADVMMPGMDGLELARRLRANEGTQSVPVLLLSAKAQDTDIARGRSVATDYMTKPFEPLELLDKAAEMISAARPPA
jgi:DNA-binding response OmpR family regulator